MKFLKNLIYLNEYLSVAVDHTICTIELLQCFISLQIKTKMAERKYIHIDEVILLPSIERECINKELLFGYSHKSLKVRFSHREIKMVAFLVVNN